MRAYKTEIKPTAEQVSKIRRTIGTCRFIYNFYLSHNKKTYNNGGKFVSANDFSKWLNNEYLPNNPDKSWVKDVSSKSVKQSIVNAQTAYKRFFKKLSDFPRFKKRRNQDVKMYFVKTDAKTVIKCERHRIQIPTLGWMRLKEYGYLPQEAIIKSGTISEKAGRFYVSVLVDDPAKPKPLTNSDTTQEGIGIDLGIKKLAIISNGEVFENINKSNKMKRLEKKLKREQRSLSRKYESKKQHEQKNQKKDEKKKERGEETANENHAEKRSANIEKNVRRVQKLYQALTQIREEHIRYVISVLLKTKPKHITIEDLNVSGMMKNRHLSKAIANQKFSYFREWLIYQCQKAGIEVRIVDRFYPSSKTCCKCGYIKKDLKLSERTFKCPSCRNETDRDLQAAKNLARCDKYKIA